MSSTVAGVATILLLSGWHLTTRRRPGWRMNRDARFYITTGYPPLVFAMYFLVSSTVGTDWMWALGCAWALVAMVMFVYGFQLLNGADAALPRPTRPVMGRSQTPQTPRSPTRPSKVTADHDEV